MSDFGKSKSLELQMTSSWIFQYRKKGVWLKYEKSPLLKVKSFLFWAALKISSI
jgi:hypothetical protein